MGKTLAEVVAFSQLEGNSQELRVGGGQHAQEVGGINPSVLKLRFRWDSTVCFKGTYFFREQ